VPDSPPPASSSAPDFSRPAGGWFVLLDGGIVVLAVLSTSDAAYRAVRARVPVPPRPALRGMLAATAVIHLVEAAAAYRTARRKGSANAKRWAVQTLVVGFPSLMELRR